MTKKEFNEFLLNFREKEYGSFDKFYEYTKTIVYTAAYRYVHNKSDAEDILSTVMIKILKYAGKRVDNPTAWLLEITKNTALNFIEKHKHEVFCDIYEEKTSDDGFNPFFEDLEKLLTEKEYSVILYVLCYGYTLKETAGFMNVSKRQTQRYYTKAKEKIKKYFEDSHSD